MRRIAVIGTMGAGKSTLAASLAARIGVAHVELDSIRHGPNWTPMPNLVALVTARLTADGWVTDGNYRSVRDLIWRQADTLVWLDYPILVPLWRVFWRTLRRIIRRQELWNGNRETWRNSVFSRDNHLVWVLRSHRKRRREYADLIARPEYAHLTVIRLRSPRTASRWLQGIPRTTPHR